MMFNHIKQVLVRNHQILCRKSFTTEISPVVNMVRGVKKKVKKHPFMKNIFLGVVDKDILYFPEVELVEEADDKQLQYLNDASLLVSNKSQFKRLYESGVCRFGFPEEFGGKPLSYTNFLLEIEKHDINPGTAFLLETQYSLIIKTLLKYGSEEQKKLYVKKILTECVTGGFALHEEVGSDLPSLQCTANAKEFNENPTYILNGEKTWIANANEANFFIVLAQFKDVNRSNKGCQELSAFIVDRNSAGISLRKQESIISEFDIYRLKFDNVELPTHCLLGNVGSGFDIAVSSFETCKFIFSVSILNLIRKLLAQVTLKVSKTDRFSLPLREYELVQYRLSKVTATLYALESSLYFLAGMKDLYLMDTCLEAVIVQNMILSFGMEAINECISIGGTKFLESSYSYSSIVNNLAWISRSFCTPELMKLYVSLKGIEFSGKALHEMVKKVRNPFDFPGYIFKRILFSRGNLADSPKLDKELYMEYHPSLKVNADLLEYCICRFQYCTETLLGQYGIEILQRQLDLIRLSEMATDIFSMIAVLGRASRAYCTGIRYSDQEVIVTSAWCQAAKQRIQMNASDIISGKINLSDHTYLKLAPDIFQNKGYFYTNPTIKNIV